MPIKLGISKVSGAIGRAVLPTTNLLSNYFDDSSISGGKVVDNQGSSTRTIQPGRCYTFNGADQRVDYGDVGSLTSIEMYIKMSTDNQVICTLQNSTLTAVSVVAGVLTFGATLSGSNIFVDSVSKTAGQAGVLLNDNGWHLLTFDLVSVSGSDFRIGTDSSSFGGISVYSVSLNGTLKYKMGESSGTTSYDTQAGADDGTIQNIAAGFHDTDTGVVVSWSNDVGYTDAAGVLIPRDESDTSLDAAGGALEFTGRVKYSLNLTESNCLDFNAVSQYVDIGDVSDFGVSDFILSMYYHRGSTGSANALFSCQCRSSATGSDRAGWFIRFDTTNELRFYMVSGTDTVTQYISVATFPDTSSEHHLVATKTGTSFEIYVDGVSVFTDTVISAIGFDTTESQKTLIGARWFDFSVQDLFNGKIFGVQLAEYSSDRLVEALAGGKITGALLSLPCAEESGPTIYDVSGGENNGTFIGTDATEWQTQGSFHWNIEEGFRLSGAVKIPALADGSAAADSNPITNYAGSWHNDSETNIAACEKAPAMVQAEIAMAEDFFFDSGSDFDIFSNNFADIDQNFNDGGVSHDQLFSRHRSAIKKDRILFYTVAKVNPDLAEILIYTDQ